MLPDRSKEAEDAYLIGWQSSEDTDGLLEAITAAVEARRPQLAARLVGLLDQHIEVPTGSPVARARQAAALLMLPQARVDEVFLDLEAAWILSRRLHMQRIKRRMRGDPRRTPGSRRR